MGRRSHGSTKSVTRIATAVATTPTPTGPATERAVAVIAGAVRPWDAAAFALACAALGVPQVISFIVVFGILDAPIPRIALENPIGCISTRIRRPEQTIQPWQFGHGETKATCLWLKNLPKLVPTNIVEGREARVHKMPPGPDRWKERSRTFTGIAEAMAEQWGALEKQVAA